jgi:hypothetical protein
MSPDLDPIEGALAKFETSFGFHAHFLEPPRASALYGLGPLFSAAVLPPLPMAARDHTWNYENDDRIEIGNA